MKSSAPFASRITAAMMIGGLSMLVTLGSASAASYNWTGTAGNGNWFTGGSNPYTTANWAGAPTSIVSSGTNDFTINNALQTTMTVNSAGPFNLRNLTFGNAAGAFTVNPNGLGFAAASSTLANNSANKQTFSSSGNVNLVGPTMNINTGAAGIDFMGTVLGSGSNTTINKAGTGLAYFDQNLVATAAVFNATAGTTTFNNGYTGTGIFANNSAVVNVNGYVTGSVSANNFSQIVMNSGAAGPMSVSGQAELVNNGQTLANLTTSGGTVSQTGNGTYSGTTNLGGVFVAGTGNVTITGPLNVTGGVQSLNSATVTGPADFSGGTTSGLKNTAGVTMNLGSTVDFNNNATNSGGDMVFNGGNLSINGTNYGALTNANNTTFGSGFNINFGVNQDGSKDYINTPSGQVDWGGANLNLTLTNTGTIANYTSWDMFDFASQTNDLASVSLVADTAYGSMTFSQALAGNQYETPYGAGVWLSNWVGGQRFIFNQNDGTLTVVPEPSTMVFAGIGAAMLGWHTWTRGRRNARMKLVEEHMRKVGEQRGLV